MLFTGSIRLVNDERYIVTGNQIPGSIHINLLSPGNNSLTILDTRPGDSGEYQCRIMVRDTIYITHTVRVTQAVSIQVAHPIHQVSSQLCITDHAT